MLSPRKKCILKGVIMIASMVFLGMLNPSSQVFAANLEDTITSKTALYGLARCYKNGNIKESITLTSYGGTIVDNDTRTFTSMPFNKGDKLTCTQVLKGTSSSGGSAVLYNGVLKAAGVTMPSATAQNGTTTQSFLLSMGYEAPNGGASNGQCVTYTYVSSNPNIFGNQTIKVCLPNVQDDKIIGLSGFSQVQQSTLPDGGKLVHIDGSAGDMSIRFCKSIVCTKSFLSISPVASDRYTSWEEFTRAMLVQIESLGVRSHRNNEGDVVTFTLRNTPDRESYDTGVYELGGRDEAAMKAVSFLSKGSYFSYDDLKLTTDEKVFLLQWDLNNVYKMDTYGCGLDADQSAVATSNGYQLATIYKDSAWQECYVKAGTGTLGSLANQQVVGFTNYITGDTTWDFDGVLRELDKYKGEILTNPGLVDESNDQQDSSANDGSELSVCSSGANSLGWIVCTALDFIGTAVNGMYEAVLTDQLQIDPDLITMSGEIYQTWTFFRDAANLMFLIAFIVVILSQLTGIGLSNYNIKKILPRLIMVVILTNLSFIFCQIAVDLSNIFGNALYNLFSHMSTTDVNATGTAGHLADALVIMLGGGAAAVGTWYIGGALATVATIAGWLPGILLTLVVALLGILFFFILLGVRQAAVIILIALAPVAVVCYALPNTKPFFDRWRRAFTALLVLFPICGIVMGGGMFASNVLLMGKENDVLFDLIAMMLQIVPFFFIPTLLRQSLQALGNIGARISNFGAGLQNRLNRGVRGTGFFQDAEARLQANSARRQLNALDRRTNGRKLTTRQAMRRARLEGIAERDARTAAMGEASRGRSILNPSDRDNPESRYGQLVGALRGRYDKDEIDILSDSFQQQLVNGKITAEQLGEDLDKQIAALNENPNDQNAYLRAAALLDALSQDDKGLAILTNSTILGVANAKDNAEGLEGMKKLLRYARHADGLYKNKHRSLRSIFNSTLSGQFDNMGRDQRIAALGLQVDASDPSGFKRAGGSKRIIASNFSMAGVGDYDESQFAGASDDQFDRIKDRIGEIQDKIGAGHTIAGILAGTDSDYSIGANGEIIQTSTGDEIVSTGDVRLLRDVEAQTANTLRNTSISVQNTAAGVLNSIRTAMGYDEIQRFSDSSDDNSLRTRGPGTSDFGLPTIESLRGVTDYTDARGVRHTVGTSADGKRVDTFTEGGRTYERTIDAGGGISERILDRSGREIGTATITRDGIINYTSGASMFGGSIGALTRSGERLSGQEAIDYRMQVGANGRDQAELWLKEDRRRRATPPPIT